MTATTPTPDARRVRRWLWRALTVSGGAAAATAIAWGFGATSASAVENPLDNIGEAKPSADVPFTSGAGDSQAKDSGSSSSKAADSQSSGDRSDGRQTQSPDGGVDHGGAPEGDTSEADEASADTAFGRHLADRVDAGDLAECDPAAPGPTDVRGLFDDAHSDRFDIGRFADRGRDLADAEDAAEPAESADATQASGDAESATCQDSDADRPDADRPDDTDTPETAEPSESCGAADGSAGRPHAEHTWKKVTGRAREAVHGFGDALRAAADDWSGDRSVGWDDWSGFELPWSGFTADPADLPSPSDVPMGPGGPDLSEGAPQTSPHDADARAPGGERHHTVTSTSDHGHHETSGVDDTGHDGESTESAAVDTDSGEPTRSSVPEFDPQYVPASVPSHSSIAGSTHADAPSGAVITTAEPFAVAAVGAALRSGLLHKSMSPGSQPGVTPD
ncbi:MULTISPECIES: hypothetical protein [Prauserella salsuginis group]|uniref:Uncharacterized protein n=1 Tax=Prauserella salsuginis TaxID=387889 RepID=A0ABW6FYC1_9PSEU|nr:MULTISPECIES: hypothetical protein [Prauserella salsuginis group]MCR3720460.1 hypothetical protein [Prauserella flava]MCR3733830.1 hypothetical protein [Prauserella salsuginis]